ncbi:MAG: nuclear transport factor 2 family protein [Rhodanobacteraceae bacterium]|nr:nuclear transport factor 2 family protein [Rhodanobacteraceae bacterium]
MKWSLMTAMVCMLAACASTPDARGIPTVASLIEAETGFARSMADRDLKSFAAFIDEDAVFINGGKPLRGKAEILAHWEKYFADAQAPFSWAPVLAEVSASNGLGYTEGPVHAPDGTTIVTFSSTWRHTVDGWRVIFDNGHAVCDCSPAP